MKLVAGVLCGSDRRFMLPEYGSLWLVRDVEHERAGRIDRVFDLPAFAFLDHYGDRHEILDTDISGWLVDRRVVVHVHQLGVWLREPAPRDDAAATTPATPANPARADATWPHLDAAAARDVEARVRDQAPFSVVHAGGAARDATFELPLSLVKRDGCVCGAGRRAPPVVVVPVDEVPADAQLELRIIHEGALVEVRAHDDTPIALYVSRLGQRGAGARTFERVESADERARLLAWFTRSVRTDSASIATLREE